MQLRIRQVPEKKRVKGRHYLVIGSHLDMVSAVLQMREEKHHEDWKDVEIVLEDVVEEEVLKKEDPEVAMYRLKPRVSYRHPGLRERKP